MNHEQTKYVEIRDTDPRVARTKDNAYGIDDIGLPEDITPDDAVPPGEIMPESGEIENRTAAPGDAQKGGGQRESAASHARDVKRDNAGHQEGQHVGPVEKLVRKIEPAGHEISDEELRDPGATTPDSPPADNRS